MSLALMAGVWRRERENVTAPSSSLLRLLARAPIVATPRACPRHCLRGRLQAYPPSMLYGRRCDVLSNAVCSQKRGMQVNEWHERPRVSIELHELSLFTSLLFAASLHNFVFSTSPPTSTNTILSPSTHPIQAPDRTPCLPTTAASPSARSSSCLSPGSASMKTPR